MIGAFDDPGLPVKVILVFRAHGGWHLASVLRRNGDGVISYLPPYNEKWSDRGTAADWDYLAERILEHRGGNAYTYEVEGFATADDADFEPVVVARAAEVVAASGGPLGEIAATVSFSDGEATVSMPLLVLPDEEHDHMLVATDALSDSPVTVVGDGTTPHGQMVFRSVEHWQRDFQRCWQLDPGVEHAITWNKGQVFLTIDEVGSIVRLSDSPSSQMTPSSPSARPFPVERVTLPASGHLGSENDAVRVASGEEPAWGWAIPMVYRAAAAPAPDARWPAAPKADDQLEAATGYWAPLLHLLLYSFGWTRPDRGLRWWYDAGFPTEDHRLRLIAETYLADGQLDWFAAWLWSTAMPPAAFQQWAEAAGFVTPAVEPVRVDITWCTAQEERALASGIPAPIGGGFDPLHLQVHCGAPVRSDGGRHSVHTLINGEATGVLLVNRGVGWYRNLVDAGNRLPGDPGDWIVDVVIAPVGWVGAYARSPKTGLWYAGEHALHLNGN